MPCSRRPSSRRGFPNSRTSARLTTSSSARDGGWSMLDMPALGTLAEQLVPRPLFVTVSGAHLYGFPSPDSDIDLRGSHLAELRDVVGLHLSDETIEREAELAGIEVELVSHEVGKYLRLLLRNN